MADTPDFANMPGLSFGGYGGASIGLTPENLTQITEYNDPSIKAARDKAAQDKLAQQILGQNTSSKWSGEGFGSAEKNAADMARILYNAGITDISQFGQGDQMQTLPIIEKLTVTRQDEDGNQFQIPASQAGIVRGPDGKLSTVTSYNYDGYPEGYTPLSPAQAAQVNVKQGYTSTDQDGNDVFNTLTPEQSAQVKNGQLTIPTGNKEYINKTTGQPITAGYDRSGGQIWSGTFAGQGSTGYGVQFDDKGNPYFYTQYGGSTNDLANLLSNPVINFVATAAAAATGGPLGVAALKGANAIANGGSIQDALTAAAKGAALAYAGQQVAQGVGGLGDQAGAAAEYGTNLGSQQTAMLAAQNAGMGTVGDIAGNIAGSAAGQIVSSGGKIDPIAALVSGGVGAGTSAVLSQIDGFTDLSPAVQKAITSNVANTLQTGNVDPTKLVSIAVAEAQSITNESKAIDPYFQTGAGTGALPATTDAAPVEVSPLTTVGMTPEEVAATNWASLYAEPTTDPATGETIVGGDPSQYPVQNFGDSAAGALANGTINVGPGGFTSGWQTSGSDRIMIQDDGTAIGINENGDQYALNPDQVNQMIANGQLNTAESGYVAATGGTGNKPGGSGNASTSAIPKATTPTTNTPTTPATSKTNPFGVLPLDSSPQMLTSTIPTGQPSSKMAELHQLFNSLTPEMQDVFTSKGITPSESTVQPITTAATGGLISDETSKILDSLNPKYISAPTHLTSSMSQSPESRLGALRHISQGPLRGAGLSNRMASGGLPHKYAEAAPKGHNPEFITGLTGYYAQGGGTGQSDDIPAMLHDGDFVMDADTVASLGDGSSKAGAEVLEKMRKQVPHQDRVEGSPVAAKIADGEYVFPASFVTAIGGGSNKVGAERLNEMREKIRAHKRSAPTTKIPPKAKSPLDYLKMAKG